MAKTLGYSASAKIVEAALRNTKGASSFAPNTRLGDVLVDPSEVECLRVYIRHEVRLAGFAIKSRSIPLEPDVTTGVASTLVLTP